MKGILYEDQDILVVKKPAGMESQRGRSLAMDLESLLRGYLSEKEGKAMPYLAVVHRLDRPVAGVMVYARSKHAAAELSRQLQHGDFSKVYEAVVTVSSARQSDDAAGVCEGRLEDYLVSDRMTGTTRVAMQGEAQSRRAVLTYRRIQAEELLAAEVLLPYVQALSQTASDYSEDTAGQIIETQCLRIWLETGRHHQIRVQLAHAGMPIAGDSRYGLGAVKNTGRGSIALCASELSFRHPITGKYLTFQWNNDTNIATVR